MAAFQLESLFSGGDIETNPGPTGGGNLFPTCQNTQVVKCTVCVNGLQNKSEEIAMVMRDLRAQAVF